METGRVVDLSSSRGSRTDQLKRALGKRWLWIAWLGLPALVFWGLRTVPLAEVWKAITGLLGWQIAALCAANLAVLILFAGRWQAILGAFEQRVPLLKLLGFRLAGFGLSYFTPGPQFGGEPLQVLLLHRRQGVPTTSAVASVFFDKLIEVLANFTFLVIGLGTALTAGMLHGSIPAWLWLLVPATLVWPMMHLHSLAVGKRPLSWLLGQVKRRWSGMVWETALMHASEGEEMIGRLVREKPKALAGMLAISALAWVVMIGEFNLLLHFLGAPVTLAQSVAILTAARLAFLLPVPGGLGVLEASQYLAVQAAGFDASIGLAASLIIRARDMTLAGLGLWIGGWMIRVNPGRIERSTETWNG